MADFVLSKRRAFVFALEDDPEKTYTLPSVSSLGFEDAQLLVKIDETKDIVKRGNMIRDFILKYVPELKEKNLGGMEYFELYSAYGMNEGKAKMGESKASQDS